MAEQQEQKISVARGGVAAVMGYRGPEVIVEGARGTGKTQGILRWLHRLCCMYSGARILLSRSTRTRLTESVMVTFEEEVLGPGHPLLGGISRLNRHAYEYPGTKATMVLGGLDDATRLLSTPWDIVYVNEVTEISETLWEDFGGSLRWNHIPWQQRIGDCNPVAPGHWANQRADICPDMLRISIDHPMNMGKIMTLEHYKEVQEYNWRAAAGRCKRIITFHVDNPAYWDKDKWDWTVQGRSYAQNMLHTMSGHSRFRFFEGKWKAASGTVYPSFDDVKHVVKPFEVPKEWPIYSAYDAGFDHPTAIIYFTVSKPDKDFPAGRVYIIGEHVKRGLSVKDEVDKLTGAIIAGHASLMADYEKTKGWLPVWRYADPQHVFSSTAGGNLSRQWLDCGYQLTPWPRTGRGEEAMVEGVRHKLDDGTLLVFDTCKHTIMEFESWSYKRTANGEIPAGDDRFEDKQNDAMDCVKGFIATNPTYDSQTALVEEGFSARPESVDGREHAGDANYIYVGGRWRRMRLEDWGMGNMDSVLG